MAKAIQDGTKTQTRRELKGGFLDDNEAKLIKSLLDNDQYQEAADKWGFILPYKIGQTLWIREPAKVIGVEGVGWQGAFWNDSEEFGYQYSSDGFCSSMEIPSRFKTIPKWLSNSQGVPNGCIKEMARTFIEIASMRIERLNEISHDDIYDEGFPMSWYSETNTNFRQWYVDLWESISGKNSFDGRWVLVIKFKVISKEETL
jgi:hypothetical protein